MTAQPDLAAMRAAYARRGLAEVEATDEPLALFARWMADVVAVGLPEPNAMVLATASADGVPSARTVLLKGVDERGFAFYTNYGSAKARDLAANPRAALVFPWHPIERQVRVTGTVARLSAEESSAYFATRPHGSQVAAWASPQSEVVADRAGLEALWAEAAARFPGAGSPGAGSADAPDVVPRPEFWGGYRVAPETVEFWAGRANRLHDRLRYRRDPSAASGWLRERLAP